MKVFVKTLKGSQFEIEVKPQDAVSDVKKNIETVQGAAIYPASQQVLVHKGKVLKDETTLEENNVEENSYMVIMVSNKSKASPSGSTSAAAPSTAVTAQAPSSTPAPAQPVTTAPIAPAPAASAPSPAPTAGVYDQAASNLVAGSTLESTVQQILDMGGGSWERDTVVRALRAAFNNPERAVDYLYSGIPEQPEVQPVAQLPTGAPPVIPTAQAAQPAVPSVGPNANPLDLFPQGLPNLGTNAAGAGQLDFLRNNPQFQTMRDMVQANPQILQPLLQELGKQNPQLVRMIQEHQSDFLRLINEPAAEGEGNILGELAEAMPQTVAVTPEEREAIERLQAMGFDQALVLQVFFACNKNEELAANYLLDNMHDFE